MDTNCPYCDAEIDIDHEDGYGYEEDEIYSQQCDSCSKTFAFTATVMYCYDVGKSSCLNGGEHDYEKTKTIPEELSEMRCTSCGDERGMTEDERLGFGIGTVDDYYNNL